VFTRSNDFIFRLPFRLDRNDRYFNDTYEALPANGYTDFFQNLILKDSNIDVRLNIDFFEVRFKASS